MADNMFYTDDEEPPSVPPHGYPMKTADPQAHGRVRDPYAEYRSQSHQASLASQHSRGGVPDSPRAGSQPILVHSNSGPTVGESPSRRHSGSHAGTKDSPRAGMNPYQADEQRQDYAGYPPGHQGPDHSDAYHEVRGYEGDGRNLGRSSQGHAGSQELTPSLPPQQFHHPHFNHHRSYRHSPAKDYASKPTHTPQRSSRSVSVSEHGSTEEGSPRSRYPTKSSLSMDSPQISSSPGSSNTSMQGTPSYQRIMSSPAKRNTAVTDLDQAMLEQDEIRLRSLFGDQVSSSPNVSDGYAPQEFFSGIDQTQVDETNLDEDPVDRKFSGSRTGSQNHSYSVEGPNQDIRQDVHEERFLECCEPQEEPQTYPQQRTGSDDSVRYPIDMPTALHFNQSDVFDGYLLLQWLSSKFDSSHYLSLILTKQDIAVLMSQFCTHLLAAGVLSQIEGQTSLRERSFKPNGQYFWTKQDPALGQSELPGRLQPMWPPCHDDADTPPRPGLKYTEAEHQAAMVLMRKDYNQQVEKLQKEHAEEVERLHAEYQLRVEDLRAELGRLEQEVEKYRQLAGLERLTQTALSHAQAAQEEAGLDGSSFQSPANTHTTTATATTQGKMIALTGTPQRAADDGMQVRRGSAQSPEDRSSSVTSPPFSSSVGSGSGVAVNGSPPFLASESESQTSVSSCAIPTPPPPPPPPPPSFLSSSSSAPAPSKPIVSTKSPMKPLFWKRIQINTIKSGKQAPDSNLFWESLEEPKISFDEFDDLFSKIPVQPKKKAKDTKPKSKAKQSAKVIEAKRSQAVGILLSTIRLEMAEIEHAILHLDTSLLDAEKFRAIYENRPTDDEIKQINKQLDKHPDVLLDKPEQFLYDLHQIPYCSDRIFCFIFQATFQESTSIIENKLNNLKMTSENLMSGASVKRILGLTLALGNYMNGGSRTRGQADGFELDILPKLKDYKAKDNRTSLIQFLVMMYVQRYEMNDAGTDSVKLPLPDPSDITQAGLVNFDDISKEMARVRRDFGLAESKASEVLKKCTEATKEPFNSIMKNFFEKGKQDLADQEENMKECAKKFSETVQFFAVKPRSGDNVVTPEYFFSLWHAFCQDFKDHWKREQQRIVKLRLRETETRLRKMQESKKAVSIPTRAKTAGGLKDRLSRLSKK